MRKNIWLLMLLIAVSLGFACDGQLDEANKLVNEGNALLGKNNEALAKASPLFTELLGDNLTKVEDFDKYKADNKAKFDELVKLGEQTEKGWNDAAAKFEDAAKLKVDDKFKEYLKLGAQEFRKRSEIDKAENGLVKAFLAESDGEKINTLVGDFNKKSAEMKKEADDFRAKAEKLAKDNPGVIGGSK